MTAPTYQAAGSAALSVGPTASAVSPAWPTHQADDVGLLLIEVSADGNLVKRTSAIASTGNGGGIGLATGVKQTAGSTGTTDLTHSVAVVNAMMTVALKPAGSSPPTFQAAGSQVGNVAAATPAWPTHAVDDIALLVVESANEAVSLSTAAGFAAVSGSPVGVGTAGATGATRLTMFWCRATSTSMSSPTIADAGDHVIARIYTFRGCVTTGDPWDVTATDSKGTASTSAVCPSVTTTVDNTLACFFATCDLDGTGDVVTRTINDGGLGVYLSTPAGFVALPSSPQSAGVPGDSDGTALHAFWCRATSASMTAPTVEPHGDHVYARIVTFRGCVSSGDPWNAIAGAVTDPASTSATLPAVTTSVADTLIVMALTSNLDGSGTWISSITNANLSTPTRRSEALVTSGNGGGIAAWTGTLSSAGSSGTGAVSQASSTNGMLVIALASTAAATAHPRFYAQIIG